MQVRQFVSLLTVLFFLLYGKTTWSQETRFEYPQFPEKEARINYLFFEYVPDIKVAWLVHKQTIAENEQKLTRRTKYVTDFNSLNGNLSMFYQMSDSRFNVPGKLSSLISSANNADPVQPAFVYEQLKEMPRICSADYHDMVAAYINFFLQNNKATEWALGNWLHSKAYVVSELEKHGLPHELSVLPLALSAYNPNYTQKTGRSGVWQLPYKYAKAYGLETSTFVDERRLIEQSTQAALAFYADLYDIFQDHTLTILAYISGPSLVSKAIKRANGAQDYWSIREYLPENAKDVIPAFYAARYISVKYKALNLAPKPPVAIQTDTLLIRAKLHLKQVSEVLNCSIESLRTMNPQYKYDVIPAMTKTYPLVLEHKVADLFVKDMKAVFSYKESVFLFPKAAVASPGSGRKNTVSYVAPKVKGKTKLYYTVRTGDNLGFIAAWYNVRTSDLRYWNGISRNLIRVGQKILVYVPNGKADYYAPISKLSFEEKQRRLGKTVTVSDKKEIVPTTQYAVYTIKRGDNIWAVAKKFPNTSADAIMKLNDLTHNSVKKLKPGDKIRIPK